MGEGDCKTLWRIGKDHKKLSLPPCSFTPNRVKQAQTLELDCNWGWKDVSAAERQLRCCFSHVCKIKFPSSHVFILKTNQQSKWANLHILRGERNSCCNTQMLPLLRILRFQSLAGTKVCFWPGREKLYRREAVGRRWVWHFSGATFALKSGHPARPGVMHTWGRAFIRIKRAQCCFVCKRSLENLLLLTVTCESDTHS